MPPTDDLLEAVSDADLSAHGFKRNAAQRAYTRKSAGRLDRFGIRRVARSEFVTFETSVGVRFDEVETIFHRVSGFAPAQQKATSTIGAEIHAVLPGRGSYTLPQSATPSSNVADAMADVRHDFQWALAFYRQQGSLEDVDKLVNSDPASPCPYRPVEWLRVSTGTIVATLVRNPALSQLLAVYSAKMKTMARGFYWDRYAALLGELALQ
jgi:hypothetical protein